MFDLIPFILEEEKVRIKQSIQGKFLSVTFDGTSHSGEAQAILVCFVNNSWIIEQQLLAIQLLSKSLTGEEIAHELIQILSVSYSISSDHLVAAMRDRASVNIVAMKTVKIIYPNTIGSSRQVQAMASYSATRWWSKWEIFKQLMLQLAVRIFNPQKVAMLKPDVSHINTLRIIPFFKDEELEKLKAELPSYLAKVDGIRDELDPLEWWRLNATALPYWSNAVKKILTIQPSSAAAESVFIIKLWFL